MSTKVPIYLKRGSRKGKKEKLRDLLSSDMISPPLGDFRHTIHIGSGGGNGTFGDISFLQGKFHLPCGGRRWAEDPGGQRLRNALPVHAHGHAVRGGRPGRARPSAQECHLLPVIGGPQASPCPLPRPPPSPLACTWRPRSPPRRRRGLWAVWRVPEAGAAPRGLTPESGVEEPAPVPASSLLSLHVDLGAFFYP